MKGAESYEVMTVVISLPQDNGRIYKDLPMKQNLDNVTKSNLVEDFYSIQKGYKIILFQQSTNSHELGGNVIKCY